MIELHGWVTIKESYKVEDENENIRLIVRKIEERISYLSWDINLIDLRYCNGSPNLSIALFANRVNKEVEDIFELLKFICKEAKGSYGMIYMYDDESYETPDEFRVYVVCKGKICEKEDKYLSPLMQKIYE